MLDDIAARYSSDPETVMTTWSASRIAFARLCIEARYRRQALVIKERGEEGFFPVWLLNP